MKKNELTTAQQKRLGVAALVTALVVMGLLVWLVGALPLSRNVSATGWIPTASADDWPIWAW